MASSTRSFQFGILKLYGNLGKKRKINFYTSLENETIDDAKKKTKFGIFDTDHTVSNKEEFIFGNLVYYFVRKSGEVVDEKKWVVFKEPYKFPVTKKSNFFLHPYSGLIAFQTRSAQIINQRVFIDIFPQIIQKSNDPIITKAEIEPIRDKSVISKGTKISEAKNVLAQFDKITQVSTVVWPVNPSCKAAFKTLCDEIDHIGARKIKQIAYSKYKGFNYDELLSSYLIQSIFMTCYGYGNTLIRGIKDNKRVIINSTQPALVARIKYTEDDPRENLNNLFPVFNEQLQQL